MALVKNAARNGAVCYHHDSKEIYVLLCLFLPQGPTLYHMRPVTSEDVDSTYEAL